jgi:hypothetical protein
MPQRGILQLKRYRCSRLNCVLATIGAAVVRSVRPLAAIRPLTAAALVARQYVVFVCRSQRLPASISLPLRDTTPKTWARRFDPDIAAQLDTAMAVERPTSVGKEMLVLASRDTRQVTRKGRP